MTTELLITKQRIVTQNFNAFKIMSINIELNTMAEIKTDLLMIETETRDDGTINKKSYYITSINIILEGEDYSNWGNDDNYINNYIYNYLMNMPTV